MLITACRYGTLAVISFGLAVAFRLYQEVWSNAIVIAGFFGVEVRCWLLLVPQSAACYAATTWVKPHWADSEEMRKVSTSTRWQKTH